MHRMDGHGRFWGGVLTLSLWQVNAALWIGGGATLLCGTGVAHFMTSVCSTPSCDCDSPPGMPLQGEHHVSKFEFLIFELKVVKISRCHFQAFVGWTNPRVQSVLEQRRTTSQRLVKDLYWQRRSGNANYCPDC